MAHSINVKKYAEMPRPVNACVYCTVIQYGSNKIKLVALGYTGNPKIIFP
jgi:hypothetical protein